MALDEHVEQKKNCANAHDTMSLKGTGHCFETLSVGSVPGMDHSLIYTFNY